MYKDGDKLGEGNFAQVFKGHLRNYNYIIKTPVAIKIMKNEIGSDYFNSIVSELKSLKLVGIHENLVQFVGICQCKATLEDSKSGTILSNSVKLLIF